MQKKMGVAMTREKRCATRDEVMQIELQSEGSPGRSGPGYMDPCV